ncbi:MAG TPA: 4a-hydroxytetrahydrobiopterin dehydratase, partial [Thermoanaerobaculia bacterium]|nr:4a-hydroxytetrahydrobiopterin dehydratase [Thermoanaerobaculia bacterium]
VDSSPPFVPAPLKAERVQLQMQQMPGWSLAPDSRSACRKFRFGTQGESIAFLRRAIQAAERVPVTFGTRGPVVSYRGDTVAVTLWAFDGAFTEADVALARAIGRLS